MSKLLLSFTTTHILPRRFAIRRKLPAEFTKQYIPKISPKSLQIYQEKYNVPAGSKHWELNPQEPKPETVRLYPELIPHNIDPRYRNPLRERLERREMMLRRRQLDMPEFYVGSVLSVSLSDQFAPDGVHRFVGLCIERLNQGLWTTFTLRNVIENTAVEIAYELYNPTIKAIEVLLLEKRLDKNLLYLADAPLSESRIPFDMTPIPHPPNSPVPLNTKKVKLLPPPWKFQWFLHGYRGIDDSMYEYLSPEQLAEIETKLRLVDRYDLMKMYRSRPSLEDKHVALGDVQLQHQDLIRFHEIRKQKLVKQYQSTRVEERIGA